MCICVCVYVCVRECENKRVEKLFAGSKWRAHRKLIAPTFHLNVLKSFIDLFNANSRSVVERLRKEGEKEFDCHDYMSETTVEILLETAMGVSKKTQDQSGLEYALAVMKQVSEKNLVRRNIIKEKIQYNFKFKSPSIDFSTAGTLFLNSIALRMLCFR